MSDGDSTTARELDLMDELSQRGYLDGKGVVIVDGGREAGKRTMAMLSHAKKFRENPDYSLVTVEGHGLSPQEMKEWFEEELDCEMEVSELDDPRSDDKYVLEVKDGEF